MSADNLQDDSRNHAVGMADLVATRQGTGKFKLRPVWMSLVRLAWLRPQILFASLALNILALGLPIVILQIYDRIIPHNAADTLVLLIVGLAVVLVLDAVLRVTRHYLINWWAAKFGHSVGVWSFSRLINTDLSSFEADATGTQLRRFGAVEVLRDFYSGQALVALIDLPFVLLFLALIAMIGGPLVAVPIGALLLAGLAISYAGHKLGKSLAERQETDDRRYSFLIEVLNGLQTVKGLGMEMLIARRHERLQESSSTGTYKATERAIIIQSLGELFGQMTIGGIAIIGSLMVLDGGMSMGALAACMLLGGRTMQPMIGAINAWKQFQSAMLAQSHLREVMEIDVDDAYEGKELREFDGAIEVRNISFRYPQGERNVLENLSLKIEPGETISISGNTGCGKSTLLLCIMGILQPQSGSILFDGHDRRSISHASLRNKLAFLPEQAELFDGNILENLTAFQTEKYFDDAIALSSALGLGKVFAHLPNGLETRVDDGGSNILPRGIRQQIAVVRAIIGAPRVILFDEANAALDVQSDKRLIELISARLKACTTILVTHRPSVARMADRSFELRDGSLHETQPPIQVQVDESKAEVSVETAPALSA